MEPIKIGIVEDELIIAEGISSALRQLGYIVARLATTYTAALNMIAEDKPDLLLLDINLDGSKDGIDLAWKVKELYNIPFIFLTANVDPTTIDRAKKTQPSAYLVKPINKEDLYASIEVCLYNYTRRAGNETVAPEGNYMIEDALFIKEGQYFQKVKFSDILYLESAHVYVIVHTITGKKISVRTNLQEYIAHFSDKIFFRAHRSYVVNVQFIDAINTDHVTIKGVEIPISKRYKNDLLEKLRLG